MPWVRVDDHFDEHPKFAQAGPLGTALWLAGLAYCNRNLTDGFIPWAVAHRLVSWEFLGDEYHKDRGYVKYTIAITTGMQGDDVTSEFVIEQLVSAGLWEVVERGFMVHDYADYQPTKDQVLAERSRNADRQARHRASNADRNGVTDTVTNDDTHTVSTPGPVPNPVPVPKPNSVPGTPSLRSGAAAAKNRGNPRVQSVVDALRGRGLEVAVSARDASAVKHSSAEPDSIAEVYDAVAHGKFGDDFMRKRLSIHEAVEWVNAYAQRHAGDESEGECSCAERREWLKVNRNTNPNCEVHGDVRELGNTA